MYIYYMYIVHPCPSAITLCSIFKCNAFKCPELFILVFLLYQNYILHKAWFFPPMRLLYLFWKCFYCNLYHNTLNTWVAYIVFNSVVLWIHIFYNLCWSAKKECNNFFLNAFWSVQFGWQADLTWSLIYMFIKLNVKCLSGWLALIWFFILPNIVSSCVFIYMYT